MNNSKIPAFPYDLTSFNGLPESDLVDALKSSAGLTKREYFAGLALQGWLARCSNVSHHNALKPCDIAEVSVSMADALLEELDK